MPTANNPTKPLLGRWSAAISPDLAAAWRWPPNSGKFKFIAYLLLVACGIYAGIFLAFTAWRAGSQPVGDFFMLWSSARILLDHSATQLYRPEALHAAQVALGMDPQISYPFPYPPIFLLALWPLGLMPPGVAYPVMMLVSLLLFVWATVGSRWRSPGTIAALFAPTTTVTIAAGQTGFFAAALLVGGFRLVAVRPIAAGILFGLLSYKPQLGILVPVALVSAGLWRTIVAAAVTVIALAALATIAFGTAMWPAWAATMVQFPQEFASQSSEIRHFMPTVSAGLELLGVPPSAAQLAQLAAAVLVAWITWRCFRSGPSRLAAAALFVAAFLATPYAFVYDMPIVATAVIWLVTERYRAGDAFGTGEILVILLTLIAPAALVAGTSRFPASVSLILLLAVILRRRSRTAAAF